MTATQADSLCDHNDSPMDNDPIHLGDIKTNKSYDDLIPIIQEIVEDRRSLLDRIKVLEAKLNTLSNENPFNVQSNENPSIIMQPNERPFNIKSDETSVLCCRRSHTRSLPAPYSNIPLLSFFLTFTGVTLYLISVAFLRLHKKVNTSFSTQPLDAFSPL